MAAMQKKEQNNCLGVQFQWTHTHAHNLYIYIITILMGLISILVGVVITILMGPISQLVGVVAIVTVNILPINNLKMHLQAVS